MLKNRALWRRWGGAFAAIVLLLGLCGQAYAADEISRLVLSNNDLTLEIGDSYQLTATAIYVSGSTENATIKTEWASGTPSVATAYAGVITAKAEGTATVTATYAGKTVVVNVTVDKKVRSLTKNKTSSSLRVGGSDQITLIATYTDGTTANVTNKAEWATTNDSIATVNDGLITGVATGTATIAAQYGSQTVSVTVDVDSVRRLDSDQTNLVMKVGATKQIKLMALFENGDSEDISAKAEWSSNKESVADAFKGLITAYGTGQATITAKYGTKTASIVVNVDIAKRLDVDNTDLFLRVGGSKTIKLTAVYADGTSEEVTTKAEWSSDNDDIASADKGTVTGYSSGQAHISASYGGKTTSVSVDVETARKLQLDATSIQLDVGKKSTAKLTATYADGTSEDVTQRAEWTSDNTAVALASKGTITALSSGEAVVTAKFGDVSAKLVVDVDVARTLSLNKKEVSLRTGKTEQLTLKATLADGRQSDVTDQADWSIDNGAIASVSKGKITTYGSGQATVTAKYGNATAVATVQVELARKLTLDSTDLYVKEGESKQLKLTATFSDGTSEDVSAKAVWTSDNESSVYVSQGLVNGYKVGQATVTAKYGDKTATASIDVGVPRKLTISKSSFELRVGGSETLTLTALYADGTTADVTDKATWSVDNQDVALVSGGKVTGYKSGKAVVTASYGGKTATSSAEVDLPKTITASKQKVNFQVGDSEQITVTAAYADGSSEDVTQKAEWTSKTATVADVKKGLVTGIDRGSTVVTAKYGDRTVSVTVTVGQVSGLTVDPGKVVLSEGQSVRINASAAFQDGKTKEVNDEAEWSSASDKIAKVSGGLIKAVGSGKTTITVRYGEKMETINVEVDVADKLSLSAKLLVLEVGGEAEVVLTATRSTRETEDVTRKAQWKSSNVQIADVVDGLVTAYGGGRATITAQYGGKSVTVPVEIGVAQKLTANVRSASIKSGEKAALTVNAVFSDGSTKDVTGEAEWTSSNYDIVDVDQGSVTGMKYGKTNIAAKYGGKRITVPVTVDELKYLKSPDKRAELAVGGTKQLTLIATYKDGSESDSAVKAEWKSSSEGVADVKDGLITAYGKGNAIITAKFAGKTVTVAVTVK